MRCFTADVLDEQEGSFHSSEFVRKAVGTDNVCERSVVAAGANLMMGREAMDGVTVAMGEMPRVIEWPSEAVLANVGR